MQQRGVRYVARVYGFKGASSIQRQYTRTQGGREITSHVLTLRLARWEQARLLGVAFDDPALDGTEVDAATDHASGQMTGQLRADRPPTPGKIRKTQEERLPTFKTEKLPTIQEAKRRYPESESTVRRQARRCGVLTSGSPKRLQAHPRTARRVLRRRTTPLPRGYFRTMPCGKRCQSCRTIRRSQQVSPRSTQSQCPAPLIAPPRLRRPFRTLRPSRGITPLPEREAEETPPPQVDESDTDAAAPTECERIGQPVGSGATDAGGMDDQEAPDSADLPADAVIEEGFGKGLSVHPPEIRISTLVIAGRREQSVAITRSQFDEIVRCLDLIDSVASPAEVSTWRTLIEQINIIAPLDVLRIWRQTRLNLELGGWNTARLGSLCQSCGKSLPGYDLIRRLRQPPRLKDS